MIASNGLWADVSDLKMPTAPNALDALAMSSYLLWVLTGRKWSGVKTVTEEYVCINGYPCVNGWQPSGAEWAAARTVIAGRMGDPFWGWAPGQAFLFLRKRPARKLIEVRRMGSGETLDLSQFGIYDYAFMAPKSGQCGGTCFDPCGLEVTYEWGSVPPAAGRIAAIDLANEFVNAVECPDECRLPERVTSVSRQGLSYQLFDPQDYLDDGRVGLYSCDSFIKAVNPNGAQALARVFSVDLPMARRRTDLGVTHHRTTAPVAVKERAIPSMSQTVTVPESGRGWFPIEHRLGMLRGDVAAYDAAGRRVVVDPLWVNDHRVDVTLDGVEPGEYTVVVLGKA